MTSNPQHTYGTELMLKEHDAECPWVSRDTPAPGWREGDVVKVEGQLCQVTSLHTETNELDGHRHTWTRIWLREVHPATW